MNITRLILKAIRSWQDWQSDRRLERALPSVAKNKKEIAILRRKHKNTKPVIAKNREAIHDALRQGRVK